MLVRLTWVDDVLAYSSGSYIPFVCEREGLGRGEVSEAAGGDESYVRSSRSILGATHM